MTLRKRLTEAGIDVRHLFDHPSMVTTTKIRISSGGQVLVRIDGSASTVPEEALAVRGANGAEGATPARPLTVIDAHDPRPWAGLQPDLVTPNAQEAARMLDLRLPDGPGRVEAVARHREALLEATGARAVVITLDRDRTVLFAAGAGSHRTWARPAAEKQASGAGDTFVSALTLARSAGLLVCR